jgi:hypothetical protein
MSPNIKVIKYNPLYFLDKIPYIAMREAIHMYLTMGFLRN